MGTVLAFGSVRSCAVTTLAVGLAATWPAGRPVLIVEADPAGGTLAASSGWPAEPSLVSLAAAARRSGDPALVWEHCHQIPAGASVLAGPSSAEQARGTLGILASLLGRLGELDGDMLMDCGRLDPGSPTLGLWERADRPVVVCRPRLADLQAVASWMEGRQLNGVVSLVTVGDGPYPDHEITGALGLAVLARLPWDPDAAEALATVPASSRQLRLAPLVRSARTLADQLAHNRTNGATAPDELSPPEPSRSSGGLAVGSRLLRAWRPDARRPSNGSVPKDASR